MASEITATDAYTILLRVIRYLIEKLNATNNTNPKAIAATFLVFHAPVGSRSNPATSVSSKSIDEIEAPENMQIVTILLKSILEGTWKKEVATNKRTVTSITMEISC